MVEQKNGKTSLLSGFLQSIPDRLSHYKDQFQRLDRIAIQLQEIPYHPDKLFLRDIEWNTANVGEVRILFINSENGLSRMFQYEIQETYEKVPFERVTLFITFNQQGVIKTINLEHITKKDDNKIRSGIIWDKYGWISYNPYEQLSANIKRILGNLEKALEKFLELIE